VLEIAWTILPILIMVVIAIPSFRLLYYGDKAPDAAMTVKVTGHQWYWSYEYPDQGNFSVDSRILAEADRAKLKPNQPRMLAVDEEMVIPANTVLPVITGATVVGNTLLTSSGSWSGTTAAYTYQWKRGGVNIGGATTSSYLLVSADLAAMISVTVAATNTAGSASATAVAVGPVTNPVVGTTSTYEIYFF